MKDSTKRFFKMTKGYVFGKTMYGSIVDFRGDEETSSCVLKLKCDDGKIFKFKCKGYKDNGVIYLERKSLFTKKTRRILGDKKVKAKIRNSFDMEYVKAGWFLEYYISSIRNVRTP